MNLHPSVVEFVQPVYVSFLSSVLSFLLSILEPFTAFLSTGVGATWLYVKVLAAWPQAFLIFFPYKRC